MPEAVIRTETLPEGYRLTTTAGGLQIDTIRADPRPLRLDLDQLTKLGMRLVDDHYIEVQPDQEPTGIVYKRLKRRTVMTRLRSVSLLCAALLVFLGFATDVEAKKKKEDRMNIEDGVLDEILLKVALIGKGIPVVVRTFSTENADLGTGKPGGKEKRVNAAKTMVKIAPDLLLETMQSELERSDLFGEILIGEEAEPPDEFIIVEGEFVFINPGSRAKRYWGGFSAGKSGMGVKGRVLNGEGEILAEFKHRKHSGIGIGGGNYIKFMSDDTKDVGTDIAEFLVRWASGNDLD